MPNVNAPSGGMGTLMKQGKILQANNYNVSFIYIRNSSQPDFNPRWMEFSIDGIKLIGIDSISEIHFSKDDILMIPEGFGDLVKETKDLPCKRAIVAQSWIYILNSMSEPFHWKEYGVNDVISISDGITDFINEIMPNLNIYQYKQSINHNIFTTAKNKEHSVCFSANRGEESRYKALSAVNIFRKQSKHSKMIYFHELRGYSRLDFANILSKSSICLYTDEVAGFGTLPLEAMACNTHVVGFKNIGNKEYVNDSNGFWVANGDYIELGKKLTLAVDILFESNFTASLLINERNTSMAYNELNEELEVVNIFDRLTA